MPANLSENALDAIPVNDGTTAPESDTPDPALPDMDGDAAELEAYQAAQDTANEGAAVESALSEYLADKEKVEKAEAEKAAKAKAAKEAADAPTAEDKPEDKPAEEEEKAEDEPAAEEPSEEEKAKLVAETAEKEKAAHLAKEAEVKAKKDAADLELAERMAKLANQERRIRQQVEEAKTAAAAAETKAKTTTEELEKLKAAVAVFDSNPIRAAKLLQGLGVVKGDMRAIAARTVEISKNPSAVMEEELQALREDTDRKIAAQKVQIEAERTRAEKAATEHNQQQERVDTARFVENRVATAGEKFELIAAYDRAGEISNQLYDHFLKTGEVLALEPVLEHAEKQLEEQLEKRVAKTKKFGKYTKGSTAPAPKTEVPRAAAKAAPRTLTNSVTPAATRAAPRATVESETWEDAFAAGAAVLR